MEKLSNRVFKVKHKQTSEYWHGHGSVFGLQGKVFHSALDAAHDIDLARIRLESNQGHRNRVQNTLANLVIIEEVNPENHSETINFIKTEDAIAAMRLQNAIKAKYGYPFLCLWLKVTSKPEYENAKYLVKISNNYKGFRERLKELGCSSRTYKKLGDWLVIFDDDAALRIKLLDGYDQFIVLETFIEDLI
jgi:hypothetical protein